MDHNKDRALDSVHCDVCNTDFSRKKYYSHIVTERHLDRQYKKEQQNKPITYLNNNNNTNNPSERSNEFHSLRTHVSNNNSNSNYFWNNNWSDLDLNQPRTIEQAIDEITRRFKFKNFQTASRDLTVTLACGDYDW